MTLAVNGSPVSATVTDGWVTVRRTWADGDRLTVSLPMSPRLAPVDER
jgi:DUF1680 family protein